MVSQDAPVSNEVVGPPLDLVQLAIVIEEANDDGVHDEEHRRADDSADERIVVADDGVLHRVRQQEQDDEVERIDLRQLALAGEPQSDEEKPVDDDRPQDLLENRDIRREEELVEHGRWAMGDGRWAMGDGRQHELRGADLRPSC